MGATESQLELDAWAEIAVALPDLEPDVEALLVRRPHDHFIVPIDDCYRLVGLIRTRWRGFTGGREVWEELARFFAELDRRSRPARALHTNGKEARWHASSSAGGR
jgi:hypothetical protein